MQEIPGKAAIDATLKRIITADRPGIALKHYTSLFTLLDMAGTWATPSCLIMPEILSVIQNEYVLKTLEDMDKADRKAVEIRYRQISGLWLEFVAGTGAKPKVSHVEIFDDWHLHGIVCPLYLIDDDTPERNRCAIRWRRPSGCLATNPLFITMSRKLDERLYGTPTEENLCIPIIEILSQHFEGQSASRRLILPRK